MSHYDDFYDRTATENRERAEQIAADKHEIALKKVEKALAKNKITMTEASLAIRILELKLLGLI